MAFSRVLLGEGDEKRLLGGKVIKIPEETKSMLTGAR